MPETQDEVTRSSVMKRAEKHSLNHQRSASYAGERVSGCDANCIADYMVIGANEQKSFALSRETELRRQIADELDGILGTGWIDGSPSATRSRINILIEKLRGNR